MMNLVRTWLLLSLLGLFAVDTWAQRARPNFPQRKFRRSPIDSKVFLGNWWDYYNRATRAIDSGDLKAAEADLREALKLRPDDNPNARAYGVRFQEYYPHYELGIILFDSGRYSEALRELQLSIRQSPLEETYFYIHEAQRQVALQTGSDLQAPQLLLEEPLSGIVTNRASILFRGRARDDLFVDEVTVGVRSAWIDKAKSEVTFELEVPLEREVNPIEVTVRDLVGHTTTQIVEITVDRQGPILSLRSVELAAGTNRVRIRGTAHDPREISGIAVNSRSLAIPSEQVRLTLDEEIQLESEGGKVRIELIDGFGNNTIAEIDPKMKVGKAAPVEERVRVASLDLKPAYFSATGDRRPHVDLTGVDSGDRVFLDDIFVDIRVRDSAGIKRITCNGEEQYLIEEGIDLSLSYHWTDLHNGTNTLSIVATNSNDLETSKTLILQCRLPKVDPGLRLGLVVEDIQVVGIRADPYLPQHLDHEIGSALSRQNRFDLLPRGDQLVSILREREMALSPLADKRFIDVTRPLSIADLILEIGGLEYEREIALDVIVKHVQTGLKIEEFTETVLDKTSRISIRETADRISNKLEREFPIVDGTLIRVLSESAFHSDLSNSHNLHRGLQVVVFESGEEVFLSNGRTLGPPPNFLGPLSIERVQQDYSDLRKATEFLLNPKVGDLVVTR